MTDDEVDRVAERLLSKLLPTLIAALRRDAPGSKAIDEDPWEDRPIENADTEAWARTVFETATTVWKADGNPRKPDYVFESICSYCRSPVVAVVVYEQPVGVLKDDLPSRVRIACRCGHKHIGRPDTSKTGCGNWGYIPMKIVVDSRVAAEKDAAAKAKAET